MAILLLTRPAAASARTRARVLALRPGVRVVESPVLEIVAVPVEPGSAPAGLILTSENGAEAAGALGFARGMRAWCVGARTAEVAREAGLQAASAEGDAEQLLRLILSEPDAGPLLHLRGEHARGDIAPRLRAAGRQARDAVAYRQKERRLTAEARVALGGPEPVVLPLYSPRSAAILAAEGPFAAPLKVIAISAAAARPFEGVAEPAGIRVVAHPDGEAMLSAILDSLPA